MVLMVLGLLLPAGAHKAAPRTDMAQYRPCVWPNKCAKDAQAVLAQFKPCVWPNRCSSGSADL